MNITQFKAAYHTMLTTDNPTERAILRRKVQAALCEAEAKGDGLEWQRAVRDVAFDSLYGSNPHLYQDSGKTNGK